MAARDAISKEKRPPANDLVNEAASEQENFHGRRAELARGAVPAATPFARDDFDRDVWCVLGVPVDMTDIATAAGDVERAVRDRTRLSFVTPNVNWLVRARQDPAARRAIINADLSLADGAPLVALARLLGAPLKSRCAGSDLFEALRARPGFAGRRMRIFFFGGRDGSAEKAAATLDAEGRGMEAAGWLNPGFGDVESMSADAIIEEINAANADFIVVSLGAMKGQAWIERNQDRLAAPVISHLGAVVDFTAGAVKRAPRWMSKAGLEWAWRIKEEPALWRRYAGDGVILAGLCVRRALPQYMAGLISGLTIGGRADPMGAENQPAGAEAAAHHDGVYVRLSGNLCTGDLDPVRRVFREAARRASAGRVVLDFSRANKLDRAFLGLLLMLEKTLARRGGEILVAGLTRAQSGLLKANAIRYTQTEPLEEGEDEGAAEIAAAG